MKVVAGDKTAAVAEMGHTERSWRHAAGAHDVIRDVAQAHAWHRQSREVSEKGAQ